LRYVEEVPPFRATLTSRRATARVAVSGELDLSTRDRLAQAVRLARRKELALLVLDLRGVSFVDVAGLHSVIDAVRGAREAHVECELWPSDCVLRVLCLAGIDVSGTAISKPARICSDSDTPDDRT
jgi:anti-anti-sigma factor